MMDAEPTWVDIAPASKKMELRGKKLLHAGPPMAWKDASGPMRGAIIGAVIYEGWAETEKQAIKLVEEGEVTLDPDHHHDAVGPMAGVISPSMPVYELEDKKFGHRTYSNMNEGIGKVLRYGAYSREVLDRLEWMSETVAPVLRATVRRIVKANGGLPLKPMIAQALTMGDDCHNRYVATTSLFAKQIAPHMVRTGYDAKTLSEVGKYIDGNNFTMLNMGMAAGKAMTLAAHGVKYSTLVTVMTRNGTEAGIWVSSLGRRWFTAPAPVPKGLWFPGFTESDANPDLGDSSITETAGYGGFAMAAAPAIVSWVGGSVQAALDVTERMYEITQAQHKHFLIPFMDFKGTPVGIDLRKVLKTGVAPTINTGIAHRKAGVGQVGAGTVTFPIQLFKDAFAAYVDKYGA
ncbi:MAG: DUF1116 domain-containing protein [Nitrososphaerota archaeon]|nr:DUF1116 domain-containing protein [Nitrososphaerota archaeon]MDG7023609.1 DUF1116 domain-containing protein [Nitrososphaerota archaeon]